MSFIDLFAKGQQSSVPVRLAASRLRGRLVGYRQILPMGIDAVGQYADAFRGKRMDGDNNGPKLRQPCGLTAVTSAETNGCHLHAND